MLLTKLGKRICRARIEKGVRLAINLADPIMNGQRIRTSIWLSSPTRERYWRLIATIRASAMS